MGHEEKDCSDDNQHHNKRNNPTIAAGLNSFKALGKLVDFSVG
jgi:hypothetical protein